jgi:hypothetical protein
MVGFGQLWYYLYFKNAAKDNNSLGKSKML